MSLPTAGVWQPGVWAPTVWTDGVWYESGGAPAVTIRGRRRRTRRYVAPSREGLRAEFATLAEAAPDEVRQAVAEHLRLGRQPESLTSRSVNWESLLADAQAVSRLLDLWVEYVNEEDDVTILLLEL